MAARTFVKMYAEMYAGMCARMHAKVCGRVCGRVCKKVCEKVGTKVGVWVSARVGIVTSKEAWECWRCGTGTLPPVSLNLPPHQPYRGFS